jgi:formate/nitrite transporter FocA (FNT family)
MYYLFAGRIASRDNTFMSVAAETYGLMSDKVIGALRIKNLIVKNLIPVTLGNIVGGMLFTALPFWFVYRKKEQSEK